MTAYVTITNYGADTITVCPDCGEHMPHGSNDAAAALEAAEHNAGHHRRG
jgi:hypothetical protein